MPSPEWNIGANRSDSFGAKGRLVTPGPGELDPVAKSIYMLTDGDITFQPLDNAAGVLLTATLPAGAIIPYMVRRVTACTGTCATID